MEQSKKMRTIRIGNVTLDGDLTLAPLAGYTDIGMRYLAVKYGAALTVTEMVSAKGLVYNSERTKELLATAPNERVTCVQLFGAEPEYIAAAIRHECLQKFDIIDINMGCPVPKIVKNREGSALLEDVDRASDIVYRAVEAANGRPVTVKMRLGVSDSDSAVDFALAMQRSGAAALTVHGRTRDMMYSGVADHARISDIVSALSIPVLCNGDVCDKRSLQSAYSTGAAGVAIGRAAVGNPYLFSTLRDREISYSVYEDILTHIRLLRGIYNDHIVAMNMKKHLCDYGKHLGHSKCLKLDVFNADTLDEILKIVDFYFSKI